MKDHGAAFDKLLQAGAHKHNIWQLFADFAELSALALAAIVPSEKREERYMAIAKRYEADEMSRLTEMFAHVVGGLDESKCDFLGAAFMRNELSNHWTGQYFTPYPICRMMGEMLIDEKTLRETIDQTGFVTLAEPCSGSGAMILGFAEALEKLDLIPMFRLYVTAVDIASVCVHMSMVQLSLCGIPGVVIRDNSLTGLSDGEERELFETTGHHIGGWNRKLRRNTELVKPVIAPGAHELRQLELF